MEVDTGALRSLIHETTYKMFQTQTDLPPLQSTTAQLWTYTGEHAASNTWNSEHSCQLPYPDSNSGPGSCERVV